MYILKMFFFLIFLNFYVNDNIYEITVNKMNGELFSLSSCEGKKILIVTLPISNNPTSDSLLYSLDSIAILHAAEIKVIAVPSYEDGFKEALKTDLNNWYHSKLNQNIIITDGLYTRNTSGNLQHPLFKWLSTISNNGSFDVEIKGPNHKFFVSPSGKLYGVLQPHTKIWSKAVFKTIKMNVQ